MTSRDSGFTRKCSTNRLMLGALVMFVMATFPVVLAAQATPAAPATAAVHAAPAGPVVTSVEPARVSPGFDVDLKVTGKNFVQGAKVSFANTGIRVISVASPSSTELTVHVKVASDATAGTGSMFVINPDDREVEFPFEVTGKGGAAPPTPAANPAANPSATQRFDAFHLGSPAEFFKTHGKLKGALVLSSGTLRYEEGGQTLVNIAMSDVKEIKIPSYATATFRITLTSGKAYHFAPGSLRPSDCRKIVDTLRKALPHQPGT